MFKYENGILKIQKVDVPSLNVNIMNDLQESYQTYITKTIYDDMNYLSSKLNNYIGMEDVKLVVKVGKLQAHTYMKTQTKNGKYFYPVIGYFTRNGLKISSDWEFLRIPYMDDYGKINIDGANKVILSILRSAEDISYNMKDSMFNIAMPYANIRIYSSPKSIKMAYGRNKYNMHDIIAAMLWASGDNTKLNDIFTNTLLINAMYLDPKYSYQHVYDYVVNSTRKSSINMNSDLLSKLNSDQYKLGETRNALNETLTLDRAIGQTLSRDVLSYKAGTLVTQKMISEFKRNRINIIHVRNHLIPTGFYLYSEAPIIINSIPKGTQNCALLRNKFPEYASEPYIPVDIKLSIEDAIIISNKDELKSEQIELLINGGFTDLKVTAGKSNKVLRFSFEREIVGNYTARLRELTVNIPPGRNADEWVYYYNNPNLEPVNHDYLTCHDFIAIVSIMGQIMLTGQSPLLDRDTSFLKKVLMVNELFSETLKTTIDEFVTKYHSNISKRINDINSSNPFWSLTKKWISNMNKERLLAPADTINLSAEVSQVNHITTMVQSSAEVKDEQRHLAIPFYGRICPYETPAGKKLGLVNTKSIGARAKNGLLLTPYRKVLATADGIRISNEITWLSVKDELGKKFGDILSLKQDENGNYLNTHVLAKIPNPDVSDEPFIFKNIRAFDLVNGFVQAVPEQFLSPTAALIPFAASNDPVRISYGLSQIRQSIYLPKSQRSRILTSMHSDIFTYSDTKKFLMPCDGIIDYIDNMRAEIKCSDGSIRTLDMQGSSHIGQLDATMELHVKSGDVVKEGTCIAEAHKYPQAFVVRSPYDGIITNITDTAITIQKGSGNSKWSNLADVDTIAIQNGRIMGQSVVFINLKVSVGDFVKKGQILADTCASREGFYSPSRNPLVVYGCYGYNYEDGICATEQAAINYTSIISHKIVEKISKRTYKYARAYKINGFKYCGSGDKIGSIDLRKNIVDSKATTRSVKATDKEHGIPFEVNTVEDDKHSRTYAYNVLGFNKLKEGDKMSGMHGNKGVVSKVLKDSDAPQLTNGKTVEFVLNPCGVPSRMNLGQILHAHSGLIAEVLQCYIQSDSFNGASLEDIKYLMDYTWELANTEEIGDNVLKQYSKSAFDKVCAKYSQLPKQFHEDVWYSIENIIDWRGVFDRDGSAYLYDPVTDTFFEGKMLIGYPTFNKLMQEADEKINSRAGLIEEQYALTTSQPQKGSRSAKGQRMAEMELMALAAMGTKDFIYEILNTKSDNSGLRTNAHLKQLGFKDNECVANYSCYSRSVENLLYMLEVCGVKVDVPDSVVNVHSATKYKYDLDVMTMANERLMFSGQNRIVETDTAASYEDMED